ncbi:hypothetical protein OIU78_010394 [Salix suchowensis]|nr:hypothetical protein OIU78_010394 [Salix suchowensis]
MLLNGMVNMTVIRMKKKMQEMTYLWVMEERARLLRPMETLRPVETHHGHPQKNPSVGRTVAAVTDEESTRRRRSTTKNAISVHPHEEREELSLGRNRSVQENSPENSQSPAEQPSGAGPEGSAIDRRRRGESHGRGEKFGEKRGRGSKSRGGGETFGAWEKFGARAK